MRVKPLWAFLAHSQKSCLLMRHKRTMQSLPGRLITAHKKKGMALKGFHSILRVVIHKSVIVPVSFTHPAETKKVPKDCHAYTWYPLTLLTILNNVCFRFS